MQLFHPLENVLVFFNCVRKRIVTGGMLERRRVLIVDNLVIESLSSHYQRVQLQHFYIIAL